MQGLAQLCRGYTHYLDHPTKGAQNNNWPIKVVALVHHTKAEKDHTVHGLAHSSAVTVFELFSKMQDAVLSKEKYHVLRL